VTLPKIVLTTTPDRVVSAGPDDDPIVQTAVLGGADFLCTRDAHLLQAAAVEYCAGRGIKITNDIDLYTFSLATNRWTRSAIITMSARSLAALKRGDGSAKPSAVGAASWKRVQHRLVYRVVTLRSR